jgi:hypothetical protein
MWFRTGLTETIKSADVQGVGNDRILYWPAVLAVVWATLLMTHDYGPGLDFAPFIILLCWLISAGAGVIACISAISERAWRRLLSAMVLPLSVLVVVFFWWR